MVPRHTAERYACLYNVWLHTYIPSGMYICSQTLYEQIATQLPPPLLTPEARPKTNYFPLLTTPTNSEEAHFIK